MTKQRVMKRYKVELDIAVRNSKAVIRRGKQICNNSFSWKLLVEDLDGDEVGAAVDFIFGAAIPDDLLDAIDFIGSGLDPTGDIPRNWQQIGIRNARDWAKRKAQEDKS